MNINAMTTRFGKLFQLRKNKRKLIGLRPAWKTPILRSTERQRLFDQTISTYDCMCNENLFQKFYNMGYLEQQEGKCIFIIKRCRLTGIPLESGADILLFFAIEYTEQEYRIGTFSCSEPLLYWEIR